MKQILRKTPLGQQAFKERSAVLAGGRRSAFLLCDGVRTAAEVLDSTKGLGVQQADIDALLELGLLEPITASAAAAAPIELSSPQAAAQAAPGERLPQERYAEGYTIATELTGKLGLKGFHLNLAVEATTCYDDLVAVAPRIRDAVGLERYAPLEHALFG